MARATGTRSRDGKRYAWGGVDLVVAIWVIIPLLWIVSLSFKTSGTITGKGFNLIPTHWTLGNYRTIFKTSAFLDALRNSVVVAVIATLVSVILASFAAYAISRLRFRGKKVLVGASLLVAMFPQISLVTPLFNVERSAHLFNTWWGLIIPYIAFSLPLAIYTLSAFFREIPRDLERAAQIDGATPTQAFVRVIAPLAMPGMVTSFILVFLFCWNDFLFAISFTATSSSQTVPAAIAFFTGNSSFENPIGNIAAAAVIITIPILFFVLFFQRRIVAGLTSGAVKG
ncbi:carbohydrate ABC transporter permease [Acidiferrimicrobium sp. IK]|uniref:carbohydrate ABC transporter permease n=1 Tax=Acidiferrimicrobium sp. IK TaxID=2871700 RepID=UPI0021CB3E11|nr:carbohydrate ABC transporter permease [Acidiferrimicrobium sp. IK]MCU4184367.1 carbohydrate ABC transporter permease [Acidiferrimicrobium sp. IK]